MGGARRVLPERSGASLRVAAPGGRDVAPTAQNAGQAVARAAPEPEVSRRDCGGAFSAPSSSEPPTITTPDFIPMH